jgi:predicted ATPase
MLEFIRIQRFKPLIDASFPLKALNLFTGLNGMGKSSLIQTLLLLRQSFERNTLDTRGLLLRGDYVMLGTGRDVLSANADVNNFEFLLKWKGIPPLTFQFAFQSDSDLQPLIGGGPIENAENFSLFNRCFQYLSADRISPMTSYDASDYHIRDLNSLGNRGEYTVHFVEANALKPLTIASLRHPAARASSFLANLNAWMSEISPGVQVKATVQPQTNTATLAYAFVNGQNITADFRPQNVGFGLTYSLPVVVALLRSKPKDLLIIENPESHLHPAGQSVLGKLSALAASGGVQLIMESHSDHFLNGVRVAVKEGLISADDVSLFFLQRPPSSSSHSVVVSNPKMDERGRLNEWPEGFFDEWDKKLEQLL